MSFGRYVAPEEVTAITAALGGALLLLPGAFASAEDLLQSPQLSITNCVVLDVRLPGMSGLELQRRFQQIGCSIPVILITANPDDHVREQAQKVGAALLLGKPFSAEALLGAIYSALSSPTL